MLIDFKVANFRSIAEPLTFSMQGSKASKASIETGSNAVPYLLRAAAIFGANGSGKTNLLMAADVLQRLLSGEITARPDPDEGLGRYYEPFRSEEHTSELQSLMRISYAVFCLKKKNIEKT